MGWTAFPTWAIGQVSDASDWNNYVAGNMNFLANPPAAKVYRNGALTAASGNPAPYDSVLFDTYGGWSPTSFKYTVQVAGTYMATVAFNCVSNADQAVLTLAIFQNAAAITNYYGTGSGNAGNTGWVVTAYTICAVNDTLYGEYTASASLACTTGPTYCFMNILKVSN